jgi:hypothetical protein
VIARSCGQFYAALRSGSSALDVPHLRRSLPAANAVRFVGLLWHDSIMESDGLEPRLTHCPAYLIRALDSSWRVHCNLHAIRARFSWWRALVCLWAAGLECSTQDASLGYLDAECVRYMDALITQATEAGLWVILAARAKYAAGWWLGQPDRW